MKIIKPSFEIIEQGTTLNDMYKHIELCGRTCYKSTDKITEDSSRPFVSRMIKSKHTAMLEHGTVYLKIPYGILHRITHMGLCSKYIKNPYSKVKEVTLYENCIPNNNSVGKSYLLVTTNYRVIIENGWLKDLKYMCAPTDLHPKRVTVKFICNRQISHEFVRHRKFSFAMESTRYCDYVKDKFNRELTYIQPCWCHDYKEGDWDEYSDILYDIENKYLCLRERQGWDAQEAAIILPNSLKTELIMTGFIEDWEHFLSLRALGTTGAPHPQAKELALPLYEEFKTEGYITVS